MAHNVTFNKKKSTFLITTLLMVVFTVILAFTATALTDTTRPTILSVSPANNGQDVSTTQPITILFSEDMDSSTINANTITVMQRPTPAFGDYTPKVIDGTVTYTGRTAAFTPYEPLSPNQQYGNVFTITITTGATDLAGNALSENYVWSITTGNDPFNTGASTSQANQNPSPISEPVTPPAVIPPAAIPPVTTTTPTTNTLANISPLMWIIAGLVTLLLIALLISLVRKPARQQDVNTKNPSPFGDVHPVMALEGIGPQYNKKLHAMGILNTQQLWEADAKKIAKRTGAPQSTVEGWQNMAELASVKDIGPQYAELLERSGIHSIEQLKEYDPDKLLKLIRKKQDSLKVNIQGNSPGYATVESWIDQARDHKFSSSEGQVA